MERLLSHLCSYGYTPFGWVFSSAHLMMELLISLPSGTGTPAMILHDDAVGLAQPADIGQGGVGTMYRRHSFCLRDSFLLPHSISTESQECILGKTSQNYELSSRSPIAVHTEAQCSSHLATPQTYRLHTGTQSRNSEARSAYFPAV